MKERRNKNPSLFFSFDEKKGTEKVPELPGDLLYSLWHA